VVGVWTRSASGRADPEPDESFESVVEEQAARAAGVRRPSPARARRERRFTMGFLSRVLLLGRF
jgi:hypothetical protein